MKTGKYKLEKLSARNSRHFVILYKKFISSVVWVKKERKKNAGRFLMNAKRNKNYNIFLVYYKKMPVAFFCFVLNHRCKKTAFLHGIFVEKEYRKKGLALLIRKKELEMLKSAGMNRAVLRTWSSNNALIEMNKKTGFSVYRKIVRNRVDGSDTLWFEKELY